MFTVLSKYMWDLNGKEVEHEVSWSIASIVKPYSRETKKCQLFNIEKTLIANQGPARELNRRWKIMTRCRHRDSHLLTNWVSSCQQQQGVPLQELPQVAVQQGEGIQRGLGQVHPVQGEYQNENGGVQAGQCVQKRASKSRYL